MAGMQAAMMMTLTSTLWCKGECQHIIPRGDCGIEELWPCGGMRNAGGGRAGDYLFQMKRGTVFHVKSDLADSEGSFEVLMAPQMAALEGEVC